MPEKNEDLILDFYDSGKQKRKPIIVVILDNEALKSQDGEGDTADVDTNRACE